MLFLRSRAEMLLEFRTGPDRSLRDTKRQADSFQGTVHSPGGRFRTTPLCDVISAQPSLDVGQINRNK